MIRNFCTLTARYIHGLLLLRILGATQTVMIIALGANDGLRGLPVSLIQKNLNKLVLLSTQHHTKVLLVGLLLPINYGPLYRTQSNATTQPLVLENIWPFLKKTLSQK
jgi:acyl-CoA thioesterase-1